MLRPSKRVQGLKDIITSKLLFAGTAMVIAPMLLMQVHNLHPVLQLMLSMSSLIGSFAVNTILWLNLQSCLGPS